jgi:2-methylisocitrate lyase-like PEP mutase family enzyme
LCHGELPCERNLIFDMSRHSRHADTPELAPVVSRLAAAQVSMMVSRLAAAQASMKASRQYLGRLRRAGSAAAQDSPRLSRPIRRADVKGPN